MPFIMELSKLVIYRVCHQDAQCGAANLPFFHSIVGYILKQLELLQMYTLVGTKSDFFFFFAQTRVNGFASFFSGLKSRSQTDSSEACFLAKVQEEDSWR
jgi:hypothetical protein